jgi:hypothetical protein
MSNFYGATGLIGGAAGDLDNIDGTSLAAGDGAVVITSTTAYLFYLNASSGAVESSPYVISPDANAGNKRWILLGVLTEDVLTELLKLLDTDKSHSLSLKWNEDDTANRILNIEVQGGDRTLVLHENLTIGNGEAGTITFSASGKTLTIAGSATINDWFDQSVKQAASPTFAGLTLSGATRTIASLVSAEGIDTVADEDEIVLATGVSGWGFAQAGDNEEWIQFSFSAAGVVTVIANSAHAVNTDTDGNLCVYDAGSGIAIKNRLGASKTIRYVVHYSS